MRTIRFATVGLLACMSLALDVSAAVIVDKIPDVGDFWQPLDGNPNGTYVYADSFVFTGTTGTLLETVGIYLRNQFGGAGTPFRFEVYADNGNAPDPTSVLGVTNYQQVANTTLSLVTDALLAPISLVNSTQYWIAASVVGQASQGSYQMGGHTQNSIYPDNGTFWYSNDPAGLAFDGQGLTPEIGIYAESGAAAAVPEPSSLALVCISFGVVGLLCRRNAHRRHDRD